MARNAGRQRLSFDMRFVTAEAGRYRAVRRMAVHTRDLGMLAGVLNKLIPDGAMAVEAGCRKLG
ncbi:MAG: hypothetical protein A2X83_10815 [Desulfuromonadales bacterium GWD2_54_10]|nr:MAG: hypothetical protein A2X83_10815 [Desulfuromonadales bacterium GWD2_54_10]